MAAVVDPLKQLVETRGDEMSVSMRAKVALARVWLGVSSWIGSLWIIYAAVALGFEVFRYTGNPALFFLAYLVVAMPLVALGFLGLRKGRRVLASLIARRLEVSLDAIGGSSTSASLSLRPFDPKRR